MISLKSGQRATKKPAFQKEKMKKKIVIFILIIGGLFFSRPIFVRAASTTPENVDLSPKIQSNNLKSFSINNSLEDSQQGICTGITKISQTLQGDHWALGQSDDYYVGQTFLVSNFDTITEIKVWTAWRTAKLSGDCVLYVYNTLPNNKPDYTSVVGSANLPCSDIATEYPTFSASDYIFDTALTVENGKLYAFAIRQEPAVDGGESWTGSSAYSKPYTDGSLWNKANNDTGESATFIIYGCTAPIPPPPPKMVCATSSIISMYNDINFITGCTEHFTTSTQPDFIEYHYYSIPYLLFTFLAIIFVICLLIMSLFFNHYGKYHNKKNNLR